MLAQSQTKMMLEGRGRYMNQGREAGQMFVLSSNLYARRASTLVPTRLGKSPGRNVKPSSSHSNRTTQHWILQALDILSVVCLHYLEKYLIMSLKDYSVKIVRIIRWGRLYVEF